MYPERIPVELIIMYRSIHLLDVAEQMGCEITESQESRVWEFAERAINQHQQDEDFRWFPSWRTSFPAISN
jgi:hypothetical protein